MINIDASSFGMGYMFCVICDCIFSLCHFLVERAFEARARRKALEGGDVHE